MKIGAINSIGAAGKVAAVMESPVVQRLNAVRRGLKQHGTVVLKDTDLDRQVIGRLETQFGKENVKVEKSNTLRVSVENFKR